MCSGFFHTGSGPNTNSFPNFGKELSGGFFLLIKEVKKQTSHRLLDGEKRQR